MGAGRVRFNTRNRQERITGPGTAWEGVIVKLAFSDQRTSSADASKRLD